MTKKSRLKNLRQENLKKAKKLASEHEGEIVESTKVPPRKGVITFKVADVLAGRSTYDIMESIE